MARSPKSRAVEAASLALIATEGKWREWGTITVARRVAKAMEEAGFRIIAMPSREYMERHGFDGQAPPQPFTDEQVAAHIENARLDGDADV